MSLSSILSFCVGADDKELLSPEAQRTLLSCVYTRGRGIASPNAAERGGINRHFMNSTQGRMRNASSVLHFPMTFKPRQQQCQMSTPQRLTSADLGLYISAIGNHITRTRNKAEYLQWHRKVCVFEGTPMGVAGPHATHDDLHAAVGEPQRILQGNSNPFQKQTILLAAPVLQVVMGANVLVQLTHAQGERFPGQLETKRPFNMWNNRSSSSKAGNCRAVIWKQFHEMWLPDPETVIEQGAIMGNELGGISEGCQHTIWRHTMDLINDANLNNISQRSCGHDLENLKCKVTDRSGTLLACILDHRDNIHSSPCKAFIQRLEWVAFSDFRLIAHFLDACSSNIDRYMCGRLQPSESLTQGQTLACLQQHIDKLDEQCQKQIYHLSEIQADNIIMDRQLYLACINDHSKFCPEIAPGSGNVYKCLMQHKLDRMMSQQCQEQLLRRQKVIARDYRVSKGLARSCKEDIKAFHCRRDVSDEKDIRLAQILLCLEGLLRNGTKVTKDCQMEMVEHRKILMEDYRLSPEIVSQCSEDITKFCNGLEVGGKTIHCLMEHTRPRKKRERVSFKCQRAVSVPST
uniref:Golgi apparatus protein 1 n=1 Tax=Timema genevievae TaxID=629358 RepID=A0A7R9JQG6_TIMGE|nr:unnamed protein product [Timema genevievae]